VSTIEVKNLTKSFNGNTVLHGVDLTVEKGEVVAIIGPSGSGKTTLLRSINLLEEPDGGTIQVGDVTIDGYGIAVKCFVRLPVMFRSPVSKCVSMSTAGEGDR
jgi:ABC-type polar amino acid transport system ATPase subunit